MKFPFAVVLLLVILFTVLSSHALWAGERARVIVTTDMKGYESDRDLDDIASMVRFLLYANEFQIEGFIAGRACAGADNNGHATTRADMIHELINRYAEVYPNLIRHSESYPEPSTLHAIVRAGTPGDMTQPCWKAPNDMVAVGDGKSTAASQLIIEAVDRPDERPVWVLVWGKSLDLAQALYDVRAARAAEQTKEFVSRLRVFDIWGQCECGGWIAHHFPGIFYIRSWQQVKGMSNLPGDISTMQDPWIKQHIRTGHGALGAAYPPRTRQAGNVEGDSPSFLYLIRNGLSDTERPSWGSWGGRMTARPAMNVWAIGNPPVDQEWADFFMYDDSPDYDWKYNPDEQYAIMAPLARWRYAFQQDFRARMDWCVASPDEANHPPRPAVNGDASMAPVIMEVEPGEFISLNANGSSDPDGDELSMRWWRYSDADSYDGDLAIDQTRQGEAKLMIPKTAKPGTVHLIFEVSDNGKPTLTRYRRVILRISAK